MRQAITLSILASILLSTTGCVPSLTQNGGLSLTSENDPTTQEKEKPNFFMAIINDFVTNHPIQNTTI